MKKKNGNNVNKKYLYGKSMLSKEAKKTAIITVVVLIVLAGVYFAAALSTGEIKLNKSSKKENVDVKIQYEEIIAGQVLNRKQDSYYVLLMKFTDNNASSLLSLKQNYSYAENSLYVYTLDLDKAFNSSIIKNEDDKLIDKPTNIDDLKVEEMTLLKVSDSKVVERITSFDNIKDYFNNLIK